MAKLERIRGSQPLVANFGYENGEEVRNDFDSKYPFNGIKEVVDERGNTWVQIPKFYRVINVENGVVKGRELSEYKVSDDWLLNHSFTNSAGIIVNYVEIAKYQMSLDADGCAQSVAGVYPSRGLSLAAARTAVSKLNSLNDGYEYFLANIWTTQLLQDLFTVEYANSSSTEVMSGWPSYYNQGYHPTGYTDSIPYHTGIRNETDNANKSSSMKYRHIENIYGNGQEVIDCLYYEGSKVIVDINGEEYTSTLTRIGTSGKTHQLGYDKNLDLTLPITETDNGSYGDYVIGGNESKRSVAYRGRRTADGYGLFSYNAITTDNTNDNGTYRIVRRLKN